MNHDRTQATTNDAWPIALVKYWDDIILETLPVDVCAVALRRAQQYLNSELPPELEVTLHRLEKSVGQHKRQWVPMPAGIIQASYDLCSRLSYSLRVTDDYEQEMLRIAAENENGLCRGNIHYNLVAQAADVMEQIKLHSLHAIYASDVLVWLVVLILFINKLLRQIEVMVAGSIECRSDLIH